MLRNLVSNAISHGSPDNLVRVVLRCDKDHICLEVTNNGPTIDPADLERIFAPLERAEEQREGPHKREGLGLGLFIVREIARAHEGDVEVYSALEETTFAVRLPRHPAPSNQTPPA